MVVSRRAREPGFTLVELLIAIAIIAIIAAITIPSLLQSRKHANEGAAVESLMTIVEAEAMFREGDREHDGNLDYGVLSELATTRQLDGVLGSGTKQGYLFEASYSFITSEFLWFATARPASQGFSGDRYFAVNQQGLVYYKSQDAFSLDTSSCLLPNDPAALPVAGRGGGGKPTGAGPPVGVGGGPPAGNPGNGPGGGGPPGLGKP